MSATTTWDDDSIQFPRLIAELECAGAFTPDVLEALCESMDLTTDDVIQLVDRACRAFDLIKARTQQSMSNYKVSVDILDYIEDITHANQQEAG